MDVMEFSEAEGNIRDLMYVFSIQYHADLLKQIVFLLQRRVSTGNFILQLMLIMRLIIIS
jgi:hypothetical protein